jgi:hypothetical protein
LGFRAALICWASADPTWAGCINIIIFHGQLHIADFGLAIFFDLDRRQIMTSRIITL